MRIIVTIQHAGHVHFFKHAIDELTDRGHEVRVFARENESSLDLLECCDIDYEQLAGSSDSLLSLAAAQGVYEARLLRRAREFDPDVMTAVGGVAVSHVASLVDARSVVFYDTEHATLIHRLAYPFADVVCTPDCYDGDIGANHERYPAYHELAYLHPDRFSRGGDVLDTLDVDPAADLVLVRLGDWSSSHDVSASGVDDPVALVEALDDDGVEVLVTAEQDLSPELAAHQVDISPDRFHDLLSAIDLYVGEGATTAAECAALGTPAIYVSDLRLGYLEELESEYGLVVNCTGDDRHAAPVAAADSLLARPQAEWEQKRRRLLADKVDATDVILKYLTGDAQSPTREPTAPELATSSSEAG